MIIHIINKNGELERVKLGLDIERDEHPQVIIPKGCIFGAVMDGTGYSLAGCMVSPGFEFGDFELIEREELLREYPQYETIIKRLTK
jgi:predicted cupin superfamily sugar epimerase